MATLIKKIKKGKPYWYAVESQRVNGRPRIVWQKYLGTIENIIHTMDSNTSPEPKEVEIRHFGSIAALLKIANDLKLTEIIDKHIKKRKQGVSIGQYILLASLNRAIEPKSKTQIGEWYEKTILRRIWKEAASSFSSQNFWRAMSYITDEAIENIERDLMKEVCRKENLDVDSLLYDTTNFTTYISSSNKKSHLAQRGHSKKKRKDLRIVSLAMLATKCFNIPLLHETYEGNMTDMKKFHDIVLPLIERSKQLNKKSNSVTLIMDTGNKSKESLSILQDSNVHWISKLVRSDYQELLEIPISKFKILKDEELSGFRAYKCKREIFDGLEQNIIIVFSEQLYSNEVAGLTDDLSRAVKKIHVESKNLLDNKKNKTKSALQRRIKKILQVHRMDSIIKINIKESPKLHFEYYTDMDAFNDRITKTCGKQILYTDRDDWSMEEVVKSYQNLYHIENLFRDMNDRNFLRWQPAFHWTDQKIKVHSFYCVLALILMSLAYKKVCEAGIEISKHFMMEKLSEMKEVIVFYPNNNNKPTPPRVATTYTKTNTIRKKLINSLDLDSFKVKK